MTKHLGWARSSGVQMAKSPRWVRQSLVWRLNLEVTFRIFFFFFTPNQLCLWRFTFLEAESGWTSLCRWSSYLRAHHSIQGVFRCKAEAFLFCLWGGVSTKNWLVSPPKLKDQTPRQPKCWNCLSFPSWKKAKCDYSELYLSLIKAILPFELLHRILFCGAHSQGCNKSQQLGTSPNKTQTPEVLSFPMATSQSPTQQTIAPIPTPAPFF